MPKEADKVDEPDENAETVDDSPQTQAQAHVSHGSSKGVEGRVAVSGTLRRTIREHALEDAEFISDPAFGDLGTVLDLLPGPLRVVHLKLAPSLEETATRYIGDHVIVVGHGSVRGDRPMRIQVQSLIPWSIAAREEILSPGSPLDPATSLDSSTGGAAKPKSDAPAATTAAKGDGQPMVDDLRREFRGELAAIRQEFRDDFTAMRTELLAAITASQQALQRDIDRIATETNAYRAESRDELNAFRAESRDQFNAFRGELNTFRGELNAFRAEVRSDHDTIKETSTAQQIELAMLKTRITTSTAILVGLIALAGTVAGVISAIAAF